MEKKPTQLRMSRNQLLQLLDSWKDIVCAKEPKEVIIKHEKNQFTIKTQG
jgi:hypothetical protein